MKRYGPDGAQCPTCGSQGHPDSQGSPFLYHCANAQCPEPHFFVRFDHPLFEPDE